jgi:DNA-binding GntR family transcriptional regulator
VAEPDAERHASRRLADAIKAQIAAGVYPAGTRLPSYRRLRDEHGIALNTAQAAIRLLAAEDLVEIRPGSGAFVRSSARPGQQQPPLRSELADLQAMLRKSRHDLTAAERAVAGLLTRLQAEEAAR